MASDFEIELKDAVDPLVLAIDVGSTATRGMVYDAHGRPVGRRAKVSHSFTVAPDGTSQIDPDQVVDEVTQVVTTLAEALGERRAAGVALDTFASSLVVVDADGHALTPCFTYADGRCAQEVGELREELDEAALQQRTGTRVHSSYWPARLRWLARTRPEVTGSAAHYLSLGDYVLRALTGVLATGTSTAAWTGLVDRHTADWYAELVEIAGIRLDQLPPVHHLDEPVTVEARRAAKIAKRWPALEDARWYAPITDGLAANVGLGAFDETAIGASCATSGALRVLVSEMPEQLPEGLWCYRVSHDRALVGGALNDVGRALAWADVTLAVDQVDPEDLSAALTAEPHETTPLVLPFFTGERSTGWAADARAVVTGIGAGSAPVEVYRGVLEGIALSYARIASQLREVAPQPEKLYCGGSVTSSRPELLQVMADAMRTSVTPVKMKRSTLHGTALLALESLAPDVRRAKPDRGPTLTPDYGRRPYYTERFQRFERVYDALFG
ncbi:gluconokinase [Ornithinimicrobium tianjinense]|uniref:Gluconate kinase n=1 Tax=Ornithinimicrobium tianjinense TaxID=1195761 RepID=A0A917BT73_9MICO|nr:gluconokinase [Ornithinimicrobium tianjinense]GGF55807.1 gluconate kinase [Ornithinimicrobium tianjinense]